jgi:hypothetical protein
MVVSTSSVELSPSPFARPRSNQVLEEVMACESDGQSPGHVIGELRARPS